MTQATWNGRNGDWHEVTRSEPCPICDKHQWCSFSADGEVARCKRMATSPQYGNGQQRTDDTGEPYYFYRLVESNGTGPRVVIHKPAEPTRADADTLNEVYAALLSFLTLTAPHRENLEARGLPAEQIERRQYRTLPISGRARIAAALHAKYGDKLLTVPGFKMAAGKTSGEYLTIGGAAGILIPVRDQAGRIVALKSRRDDAEPGRNKYSYISSKQHGGPGPGSPVHMPLGIVGPVELARVTEGNLKGDIATALSGLPTIALPSCQTHKGLSPILQALGVKTVRVALDADFRTNPHVATGLQQIHKQLTAAGFLVELETWDAAAGKGIDDVLAAGKATEIVTGDSVGKIIAAAVKATTESSPTAQFGSRIYAGCQDLPKITSEAWAAIARANDPPFLFRSAGLPVRIEADDDESPIIRTLGEDRMRHELARAADWFKLKPVGEGVFEEVPAIPPREVVRDVLASARPEMDDASYFRAGGECPLRRR